MELLNQAGWFAKFALLMGVLPLALAIAYVIWPSERKLALMRPLSLSALFAGIAGTTSGWVAILAGIASSDFGPRVERVGGVNYNAIAAGASESLVTTVFALTCLSVSWLLVAIGMRRGATEP